MNAEGQLEVQPVYDGIGAFEQYGYAVMQRNGGVGMLGADGSELIEPRYEDLKVLDSTLIAVMDAGAWMVIDLAGNLILPKGYQRVHVWAGRYLAFLQRGKWGLVSSDGSVLCEATFDGITYQNGYFRTERHQRYGALDSRGKVLLSPLADEIRKHSDSLYFFKEEGRWGVFDDQGQVRVPTEFTHYVPLGTQFIRFFQDRRQYLYSLYTRKLIAEGAHQNYFPLSRFQVIFKDNHLLGVLNQEGVPILPAEYDEVQPYGRNCYRVRRGAKWGVMAAGGKTVLPLSFDYVGPARGNVSLVKQGERFGVANQFGEVIVAPQYHRIELANRQAKAYEGETLSLLRFDANGQLIGDDNFQKHFRFRIGGSSREDSHSPDESEDDNPYLIGEFEWFYAPQLDRWGLRRTNGDLFVEPTFEHISVERDIGWTIVSMNHASDVQFDRTTYRFGTAFGLVSNQTGLLLTEVDLLDVRLEDFRQGFPVARIVFNNGRHGLIDRRGAIRCRDYAYIGEFKDGLARASATGTLSGTLTPDHALGELKTYLNELRSGNHMTDYTKFDQKFDNHAALVCPSCSWGYLDTSGVLVVNEQFSFARDFVSEIGLVECEGKWGAVGRSGKQIIPCQYDVIDFLENTQNQVLRLFIREDKYGLIDTLGQVRVSAVYDEIGEFSEGLLAVQRDQRWGFVNAAGQELITCRFQQVNNFSGGLVAVKLNNRWGFVDRDGDRIIDFKFQRAGDFKNGRAWVYDGGDYYYIDQHGTPLYDTEFDKAFDFEQGIARVVMAGKYGLIDTAGSYILRPRYSDIAAFGREPLARVRYGNDRIRYGLINRQGILVTDRAYREIGAFSEGRAVVKDKENYGYVDQQGQLVIPLVYSKAAPFSEGRAAVQRDGVCGYIDPQGNLVVDLQFSKCIDFNEGRAIVYQGAKRAGLIDAEGNVVIEPSLDRLLEFTEGRGLMRDERYRFYYITDQARVYDGFYEHATRFQYGVAVVRLEGSWGIINQKGIEIIPPKYAEIGNFRDGYAKVKIRGFNGLSNLRGELIVAPDYEYISYAGGGLFRVEQGDRLGYFDQSGNWVWQLDR